MIYVIEVSLMFFAMMFIHKLEWQQVIASLLYLASIINALP